MIELLTALLVLITAFYAWATYRILKANEHVVEAMREQAEATFRPYVIVTVRLEPDNPIFYLRVANIGRTAAANLRLTIDRSFFKFGEKGDKNDLASFSAFNRQIDSLPPDSEIIFGLAQGFVVFSPGADEAICPKRFTVTANYRFGEKQVEERHHIDLGPYLHADVPQDPIVRKLRSINESLGNLTAVVKQIQ